VPRLRIVPYADLRRVAEHQGFSLVRRRGSHCIFRHPDGRVLTLPDHGARPIGRALLRRILRDMDLGPDAYHAILDTL
jgi:predicted RNA binding protein YcfA (HicA-like mRNA interferase family)